VGEIIAQEEDGHVGPCWWEAYQVWVPAVGGAGGQIDAITGGICRGCNYIGEKYDYEED
jgi:hypothetical protein